jgi:uncharacterized protein YjaG (DUF416 family)
MASNYRWYGLGKGSIFQNGDIVTNGVNNIFEVIDVNAFKVKFLKAKNPQFKYLEGNIQTVESYSNFRIYEGPKTEFHDLNFETLDKSWAKNGDLIQNVYGNIYEILDIDTLKVKFLKAGRHEYQHLEGSIDNFAHYTRVKRYHGAYPHQNKSNTLLGLEDTLRDDKPKYKL